MAGEFAVVRAGELAVVMGDEFVSDVNSMVAAGVTSVGDPSRKAATHSTTVPLYCSSAGMISVSTNLPFSLTVVDLMSGNCLTGEPFTLQSTIASGDI